MVVVSLKINFVGELEDKCRRMDNQIDTLLWSRVNTLELSNVNNIVYIKSFTE